MNYQGIVNWLQEDNFVVLGFTSKGESAMMERETGIEVSDISSFLIATVLPIAKRKLVHQLMQQGYEVVQFQESHYTKNVDDHSMDCSVFLSTTHPNDKYEKCLTGWGPTAEMALIHLIEGFIKQEKENEDKV